MAEKFKKIDKEYTLSDSTVNCYGFRLLTSGYLMSEFQKNPIGYHMHGGREEGVLVRWDDLKCEGDKITGKPVINLTHPRGQRTVDEIENGFLNAASFGHFVVLAVSNDPGETLEGQTGPTISKWYNRECSLVDIPGNFNALNKLYDKDDNEINLADFKNNHLKMKQIILTAEQLTALNLNANSADASAVSTALADLVAKAAKVPGLENDLAAANTAKTVAETALENLKSETVSKEVKSILTSALAAKKITAEALANLQADYASNPTGLKKLVDSMPAYQSITSAIETGKEKLSGLAAKSWSELDKAGLLPALKAENVELFKAKFKEAFGKEYKD